MTRKKSFTRPSPFRDRWKVIALVAALALITGLFETATIVAIVAFIEGVTSGDLLWEVNAGPLELSLSRSELGLIAGIALLGMTLGQVASTWVKARAVSGWQFQTQMRAIRGYITTDWTTQSSETSGSLQNLMALCAGSAQGLSGLMTMLSAGGAVVIFTVAAFLASPLAAGVLLGTGVISMLALRPVRAAAREATRQVTLGQRAVAEEVGQIHDLAQEIRVHHVADVVEGELKRETWRVRQARRRAALLSGMGGVLYRTLGLTFVLVGAMVASSQEDLDVARVGVAGLLLLRSLSYGQSIQSSWQTIENNRPYIEQVGDALELYEAQAPKRGDRRVDQLGTVELHHVSYSYDGETPALSDVDLILERGETLGVVGPSGSGKSTLAQILLGLREPSSGSYVAAGVPAMEISARDWFQRVTVVPQQPRLLRASVLDNILFYRSWIEHEAVIEAARAAGLHDEIEALPDGYETVVGDSIRDLSGGQRQRLGIARALVGGPQLLVLDEPTSALDAISEARVQQTLAQLKGTVTVVIIAHRLATLNHCDRLLVLEDGVQRVLDKPGVVLAESDFYRNATRMQLVASGSPQDEPSLGPQTAAGAVHNSAGAEPES